MRWPVLARTLKDRRRSLIGWSVGYSLMALFYSSIYPSVKDVGFEQFTDNLPEIMREMFSFDAIATPGGFLNAELFALTGPLIMLVLAIGMGSDLIAGEEERHTLDLLMSHPVSRSRVVLEKLLGLIVYLAVVEVALLLTLLLASPLFGVDVGVGRLAAAVAGQYLLALVFGVLAFALGCHTGARGTSRAGAAALALIAYLLSALAPISDLIEPYRDLSPVYHGTGYEPLLNGWSPASTAILALLAGLGALAAFVTFERRDISV